MDFEGELCLRILSPKGLLSVYDGGAYGLTLDHRELSFAPTL